VAGAYIKRGSDVYAAGAVPVLRLLIRQGKGRGAESVADVFIGPVWVLREQERGGAGHDRRGE